MISLHQVSKSFMSSASQFQAVNSVSLQVQEGEIHGIIGTSGAGKSTLLRLINLLEKPDTGRVMVGNQDLTHMTEKELREARRNIGMIFQSFNLVNNRTVSGNVSIPLELVGIPKRERLERVHEFLQFVGLQHKSKQYPSQLSGGEKQRVAIARALANHPKVLLCDEPTSSLDPSTTEGILDVLKQLNRSFGLTIVIVTHEMDVIRNMCHNVSVMESGRLVETRVVDHTHG
ncbi:methionine ABC transporter ATP-binding protein [Paenibacillus sp. FA6]|uniref:methionine ABC transporter ATP-binding protein n=1 Tax=Paenibacillus sp. FA6 TaxID=3413029 RepID=UPI003F655AE0